MSAASLCEICQHRDVEFTCDRCGKLVCDEHFDTEVGFCVQCAADLGTGDPSQTPDPENMPDGVDTYRF